MGVPVPVFRLRHNCAARHGIRSVFDPCKRLHSSCGACFHLDSDCEDSGLTSRGSCCASLVFPDSGEQCRLQLFEVRCLSRDIGVRKRRKSDPWHRVRKPDSLHVQLNDQTQ